MRIAVASQGLDVASKVLRCASYMCYRVDRGMIVDCQNMPNLSGVNYEAGLARYMIQVRIIYTENE